MADVPHVLHEGDVRKIVESILGTSPPSSGGGGGSGGGLLWIDPENIPTDLVGPVSSWGTFDPTKPAKLIDASWHVTASGVGKYRLSFLKFAGQSAGTGSGELSVWTPNTTYEPGAFVKPTIANEVNHILVYQTEFGGVSGTVEPTWPIENNLTVTDSEGTVWMGQQYANPAHKVQLIDIADDQATVLSAIQAATWDQGTVVGNGSDFVTTLNGVNDSDIIVVFDAEPTVTVTVVQTEPGVFNEYVPPNGSTYEWVDVVNGKNAFYVYDLDSGYNHHWFQPTERDYEYSGGARREVFPVRKAQAVGGGSTGVVVTQGSGILTYDGIWNGPIYADWMGHGDSGKILGTISFRTGSPLNFSDVTAGEAGQPILIDVAGWCFLPVSMVGTFLLQREGDYVGNVIGHAVGTLGGVPFLGHVRVFGPTVLTIVGSDGAPITTALMTNDQLWLSGSVGMVEVTN